MTDYLLDISFDSRDEPLESRISAQLFLTRSTGSTTSEAAGTTTVTAYFDSPADRAEARPLLESLEGTELAERDEERVDWLERYEQSLEPIRIGRRFVVAPDARLLPEEPETLTIVVPQEQAFGTGSHETTALCIELLEILPAEGGRGLDIGSGSGILAIAMLRLGASKVIAFDNDPDAYAALRDNRIRNGIPEAAMPLFIGGVEALAKGRFDVVTMNIVPEVIIPLLSSVAKRLATGAHLVLSGVLIVRKDAVVEAAAREGLALVGERERGEWWAGVFGPDGGELARPAKREEGESSGEHLRSSG